MSKSVGSGSVSESFLVSHSQSHSSHSNIKLALLAESCVPPTMPIDSALGALAFPVKLSSGMAALTSARLAVCVCVCLCVFGDRLLRRMPVPFVRVLLVPDAPSRFKTDIPPPDDDDDDPLSVT